MTAPAGQLEWLEANRSGSFALGCVDRRLRRKYHALLTVREPGRGDAWNVLAEVREELRNERGQTVLSEPRDGRGIDAELVGFERTPHAVHRYRALGLDIERQVKLGSLHDQVELRYRVRGVRGPTTLLLEPLLRCRPLHEVTHENPWLDGSLHEHEGELRMLPYAGMPSIALRLYGAEAKLEQQGRWHTRFHYPWEAERGYPADEDLFSPGRIVVEIEADAELTLVVGLERTEAPAHEPAQTARPMFGQKLEYAMRQFAMCTRAGTWTVVAGYPWFGPWGRDTLIALPGLYLATGDFELASAVLDGMANARVDGLVPNIPAMGDHPANMSSVDASLLFIRAVQWLGQQVGAQRVERFMPIVCELLEALADARDPRMRLDQGIGVWMERGAWALTWMDAMVDGQPVTPRAGYAVDVDALAYNAGRFALTWAEQHRGSFARAFRPRLRDAEARFLARYWDDTRGYLADGHDGRKPDATLRPNQLWALALPYRPVPDQIARASLAAVTRELLVPAGLRTLSRQEPFYHGRYAGTQAARDRAYHQGTVWPWLLGLYADALEHLSGRMELETQLGPVLSFFARHLDHEGCIGQINEVFDGDAPHTAHGAPAQAWSVSEVYRVWRKLHAAG